MRGTKLERRIVRHLVTDDYNEAFNLETTQLKLVRSDTLHLKQMHSSLTLGRVICIYI